MALQNFVDKYGPAVSAAWLNTVDALKFTVFGDATTKAGAKQALQIGGAQSAGELALNITPTDYTYPPGHAWRYGASPLGLVDATTALLNMFNVGIQSGVACYIPAGTYLVTPGVLIFDNNQVTRSWPNVLTDGYDNVFFTVNSAGSVNAPILQWKNGTASSAVGKYWLGGSFGGITINDTTGQVAANRCAFSLMGIWNVHFGYSASNGLPGDMFKIPANLFGGSNPDPYAVTFCTFDGVEANNGTGLAFNNLNYVGFNFNTIYAVRAINMVGGGIFGVGAGNYIYNGSIANCQGWAIDDGTNAAATGGSPSRIYAGVFEIDNCQNGVRLNKGTIWTFEFLRIICRYQTSPNASAIYWPVKAVDLVGGTSPNIADLAMRVFFRIEANAAAVLGSAAFNAPPAALASPGTLSVNWAGTSGTYTIWLSQGQARTATLTNGSAVISWTGGTLTDARAGFTYSNLGMFINCNANGNITGASVDVDFADNAGIGVTDAIMFNDFSTTSTLYGTKKGREMVDFRDKATSFGRGSAATTIPNSGFGGATPIAFPTQLFGNFSQSSLYASSTFTAPRRGNYRWWVSLPFNTLVAGTKVRIAGVINSTTLNCESVQYSLGNAVQTYQASGVAILNQGDTLYITADQNTVTATFACATQTGNNDDISFVVQAF